MAVLSLSLFSVVIFFVSLLIFWVVFFGWYVGSFDFLDDDLVGGVCLIFSFFGGD